MDIKQSTNCVLAAMVIAALASSCMKVDLPGDETATELKAIVLPELSDGPATIGDEEADGFPMDCIFECTAYFTACDPPRDSDCFYIGREPIEEDARFEALNECKFWNRMRGRYCKVESCVEIPRP